MARPPDVPDPRDPASPLRLSDPAEDHARSQVTVPKAGNSAAVAMMKGAAALMRDAGLRVIASSGWESRGRSSNVSYWAVIAHHTGATNDADSALINGRSDLPGPLCNWALHENGDWCSSRRGGPITPGRAPFPIPRPKASRRPARRGMAMGADVSDLFGHKESARPPGRKVDPYFDMGPFRSGVESGEGDEDLTSDERKWLKGHL